ncbi:kinase-like domain-containing protein [Chaetomium fimeti]|uniref:Kinase-like domain-containing protein n=1 Tax=Chaetomium fimeti TaxID=1854472 RepID=A0AAE0LS31_9PEZI|nr:kinase-like domain-containing protein [Chaetomium fimeti]
MDEPEEEPWPPVPPDIDNATLDVEMPELCVTGSTMLYRVKGHPSMVYKLRGQSREYEIQKAAGDCAIPVRGRVMLKSTYGNGDVYCMGFLMDLATPVLQTLPLQPPRRRDIMQQMIHIVAQLHVKGIIHGDIKLENMLMDDQGKLRLCDFGEGRYIDENEDENTWEGNSTWHYESPNRLRRGEEIGWDPAPPLVEDDLFSLGLSIWQLHTNKTPHEDMAGDDLGLKERQRNRETVNVAEVDDPEAREIIAGLLRQGGARI